MELDKKINLSQSHVNKGIGNEDPSQKLLTQNGEEDSKKKKKRKKERKTEETGTKN